MSHVTKAQILEQLEAATALDPVTKQDIINRINKEGLTDDVLDYLKDVLQEQWDTDIASIGATLDENDPEFKKKYQETLDTIEKAKKDFDTSMNALQKEAQQIQDDTSKQLDNIQIQSVQQKISST